MCDEDVKDAVFDEVLVWSDSSAESDFYRWAWEKVSPALDTDDPVEARLLSSATMTMMIFETRIFAA